MRGFDVSHAMGEQMRRYWPQPTSYNEDAKANGTDDAMYPTESVGSVIELLL